MDKTLSSRRSFLAIAVATAVGATFGLAATSAVAAPESLSSVAVADQSACTTDRTADQAESGQVQPGSTTTEPSVMPRRGADFAPLPH